MATTKMKVTAETPHLMNESNYEELSEEGYGVCLACGDVNKGAGGWCEPDAEWYECVECGEHKVTGLENALIDGLVEFTEGEAE